MIAKFSRHLLVIAMSVLCACSGQTSISSDDTNTPKPRAQSAALFSGVSSLLSIVSMKATETLRKKRQSDKKQAVEKPIASEFDSIEAIQKRLEPGKELFFVDSSVDTILHCQGGTKIFLPANTFGEEPGKMEVCVQEYYSKTDFLSKKLSTVSNGRILESAGTVKIDVYKNEQSVDVAEGEAYSILFPKSVSGDMQTFYGEPDENGIMNWELDAVEAPLMKVEELIDQMNINVIMADSRPLLSRRKKWKFQDEERNLIHYFNEEFNDYASTPVVYNKYMGTYEWKSKRRDHWMGATVYYDTDGKVEDMEFTASNRFNSFGVERYQEQIKEFMLGLPPLDMKTVPLTNKYDHRRKCNLICFAVYTNMDKEQYKTSFKSKYEVYEDKIIDQIPEAELDYFIQASTKVGWINCDRFPAKKRQQLTMDVVSTTNSNTQFFMIFEDMNTLVCGVNSSPTTCSFPFAPKGEAVKLVAVSFRGSQPVMSIQRQLIDDSKVVLNDFQPFTIKELEETINGSSSNREDVSVR